MKKFSIVALVMAILLLATACAGTGTPAASTTPEETPAATETPAADASVQEPTDEKEAPVINMAWSLDMHGAALTAAIFNGENFKEPTGYYFTEVVENEQYELHSADGSVLALMNTIATKGASEAALMLGQGTIDCCVKSSTGMMSAMDQGTEVQILCPVHVDGIALVVSPDMDIYGWEEVEALIRSYDVPFKIGYHSPTAAPRVLIQKALEEAGLVITEDATDTEADVLLVNLNGSKNLLPSLSTGSVDAWIGPSHYPELAEYEGVGHIALQLNDFPPVGQWYDFPCCVLAANKSSVEAYPEVYQALVTIMSYGAEWSQNNRAEAGKLLGDFMGIPAEVVENASIVFTTQPTEKWMEGQALYVEMMNEMGLFSGELLGKTLEDIEGDLFNFEFVE